MNTPIYRLRRIAAMSAAVVLVMALVGCTSANGGGEAVRNTITRSYGATDPCQLTVFDLRAKPGVDLRTQGQRVVDGFEGYEAIGDVTLDPQTSRLRVTWCNSMQTEQGVVRAVSQTNLVAVEDVSTTPNPQQ